MKKNILFLLLSLFANAPVVAAAAYSDDYYDYPYTDMENQVKISYKTDAGEEGIGFAAGIPTRNPKHLFEEAKMLIEASGTPQSEATRYFLSKRFQDLQEKEGQFRHEILYRYIHAINALRNDLHTQENIVRIVTSITSNKAFSDAQKKLALAIQTEMFSLKSSEKIKVLIEIINQNDSTLLSATHATAGAAEAAAPRPRSVTFNKTVESTRFQATVKEFQYMHGSDLRPEKVEQKIATGLVVHEETSIAARKQLGSPGKLNDMSPDTSLVVATTEHGAALVSNPDKK